MLFPFIASGTTSLGRKHSPVVNAYVTRQLVLRDSETDRIQTAHTHRRVMSTVLMHSSMRYSRMLTPSLSTAVAPGCRL